MVVMAERRGLLDVANIGGSCRMEMPRLDEIFPL
jgi:hypothetical protein